MIDTAVEQPVPLAVVAREVPNREGRRGINISTLWRWIQRGIKGQRLESVMVGGIRMTSREALQRFFTATTAAADGNKPTVRTNAQRQRAIDEAEAELSAAGI